uniref:KIF-binding protein n=1 Tax=Timema genevievae TaxID=629358 RepID=A0A7R9PMD6_TIMGE|nr:unnamed protein product [Timema genevievae]
MDVKTESEFETLSSQYSQIKILEKSTSETRTLADREMKNLLETMETHINDMAEKADRDGAVRLRLVGMKCALWYERAKSLANTGRETEAMEMLSMTQKLIEPSLTGPELVFMSLIVLNHHSYLLSKRDELDECQALLEKAERVYQGLTSRDGPRQMFTEGDLFCEPSTPARDKETAEKLERLVTNNLQMLGFVHNKKGDYDKFAKYSHLVLRRTLHMKDTDPVVWITRATMLASYLLTKNRFREARHHLCAASAILDQKESEINCSEEPEVNMERRKELERHRADVAKYWLKYCLFLLSVSKTRMMGMFYNEPNQFMEHVWMQPFQPWDFHAWGHPQDFAGVPQDVQQNISNPLDSNLTKQCKNHKSEDSDLLKIDEEIFNTITMQGVGNKQTEMFQDCVQNKVFDKRKHNKVDIKEIDEQLTEWKQEDMDSGKQNEQQNEQKNEELGDGKQNEQPNEKKEELGDGKQNEQQNEQKNEELGDGKQNEQQNEQKKEELGDGKQNEQPNEQKNEELGDGKLNEQPNEKKEDKMNKRRKSWAMAKLNEQQNEQKKEELGDGKLNEQPNEQKKEELGDGKQNEQQNEKKEELGGGKQNEQQNEQKKEELGDGNQNEQPNEQKNEELGDGKQNEQPSEQKKESPKRCEEHQCDEQNLFFPNLDLSELEEQVRAEFIETTEQARSMFKFAFRCLMQVKNFYNLKEHATEYVQTIMDLSELYRYLAFYEEDIESQYSVQKRRSDTLETLSFVLRKVEPRCYECLSVNILRELAEVQLDMMGLNLRRLYAAQVAAPSMRYNAEMHSDVGARTCLEQFGDGINQEDPRIQSVDDDALPYSLVI